MTRFDIERAAMRAAMPPPAKALILALCTRIDRRTGQIPAEHSPSLAQLAQMTGYHPATVCRHLPALESAGWLTRQRSHGERTTIYELWIPGAAPIAERDSTPRAARQAPIAEREAPPSHAAAQSSKDTDHGQKSSSVTEDEISIAWAELTALTGRKIPGAVAAEAARLILDGRQVRNRPAYLRRALRADPERFAPRDRQPTPYAQLAAEQAAAIRNTKGKG